MMKTNGSTTLDKIFENCDKALEESNLVWAHVDHRWLKHYRKKAEISTQEMRDIVFPDTDEFVSDIESIEEGDVPIEWNEFKTWAKACGHTGGQISYYYLPYRCAPLRWWDSIKLWILERI